MGRTCSPDGLFTPPQKDALVLGDQQKTKGRAQNDVWERDKKGPEEGGYCTERVVHVGSGQALVERKD